MDPAAIAAEFLTRFGPSLSAALATAFLKNQSATQKEKRALKACAERGIEAMVKTAGLKTQDQNGQLLDVLEFIFEHEEARDEIDELLQGVLKHRTLKGLLPTLQKHQLDPQNFLGLNLPKMVQALEGAVSEESLNQPALRDFIQTLDGRERARSGRESEKALKELVSLSRQSADVTHEVPGITPEYGRYLRALEERCRILPLGRLGSTSMTAVTLDQVFIELYTTTLRENESSGSGVPTTTGRVQRDEKLSACEAIQRADRTILLGDPGSGKSSFVRELLARFAHSVQENRGGVAGIPGDAVPVYLELRRLVPDLPRGSSLPPEHSTERRQVLRKILAERVISDCEQLMESSAFSEKLRTARSDERWFLVLDGLDEVPQDSRHLVREMVAGIERQCLRVIVTCRIRSYADGSGFDGFQVHTLADLDRQQIERFVAAWYRSLHDRRPFSSEADLEKQIRDLQQAAFLPKMKDLPRNPMRLTTMALVHDDGGELPREMALLLERAIEILARRWRSHQNSQQIKLSPELAKALGNQAKLWTLLEHIAYEVHFAQSKGSEETRTSPEAGTLAWGKVIATLVSKDLLGEKKLADEFLDYVDQQAGIFVGLGGAPDTETVYSFPHRTFQEFLAGRHLLGLDNYADEIFCHALEGDFWYEAVSLGAQDRIHCQGRSGFVKYLVYQLVHQDERDWTEQVARSILWAGAMTEVLGTEQFEADCDPSKHLRDGPALLKRLRNRLAKVLTGNLLPARERAEAGRILARLGDPRPEATTVEGMQFCCVPKGPFFMGAAEDDEQAQKEDSKIYSEVPAVSFDLNYDFWISRHPVTGRQYSRFVEDGGYRREKYWREARDLGIWDTGILHLPGHYTNNIRSGPDGISLPNHPVTGITWFEALAFCRWLTYRAHDAKWINQDWSFAMPSEPEWEKTARGGEQIPTAGAKPRGLSSKNWQALSTSRPNPAPSRRFPFLGEPESEVLNSDLNPETISAVGAFPSGRGPYGTEDQAGNVFEWTRSNIGIYPYPESFEEREELDAGLEVARVLRGGAFYWPPEVARCSARFSGPPNETNFRVRDIGFRVVLLPFSLEARSLWPSRL